MLRIGFLPSDYNPMVLLLGEAEDFRALAGVLRHFARAPSPVELDALPFCSVGAPRLALTPAMDRFGIDRQEGGMCWRLDGERAGRFALQLDALADPAVAAASEMLECSTAEEIPVKASRGEYTDDFLAPRSGAG